jgi:hypothetical protein
LLFITETKKMRKETGWVKRMGKEMVKGRRTFMDGKGEGRKRKEN